MGTANEVLKKFKNGEVKYLDMRFTDPKGKLQHLTMDGTAVDDDLLNSGVFFDGSSISGWKAINESDMILKPDLTTTVMDPFTAQPTLIVFCDVLDAVSKEPYERDPRATARKVKNINKPYARKIQILTVMEQRAKVMKKAEVVRIAKSAKASLKRARKK